MIVAVIVTALCFIPNLLGSILRYSFYWLSGTPTRSSDGSFSLARDKTAEGRFKTIALFPIRLALLPLFLLWQPIRRALGLQYVPRQQRQWANILWGAPALIIGTTAIATAFVLHAQSSTLMTAYRDAAVIADTRHDLEATEIYLERLMRLESDDKEMQFNYARVLEARGDLGRAVAIMSSLAPEDRVGFAPAHLWMATWLLSDPETSDIDRLNCRHHLEIARRAFPDAVDVHEQLAALHLFLIDVEGREPHLAMALRHLETAAEQQPALYYRLARVQQEYNDAAGAAKSFAIAERHFRLALEGDSLNHEARTNLAGSLLGLSRFEEARAILLEGLNIDGSQSFNVLLAETIVAMFEQKRVEGVTPDAVLFAMLIEAMQYNPKSTSAAWRLLTYGVNSGDADSRTVAIDLLEDLLANGEGVAMAHLLLGIHFFNNEGNSEASLIHLEAAYSLDPSLSDSANNFAWLLAHQDPPDYERALAIIDSVLLEHPDDPSYLDTRGHICLRLGRWHEALRDLEKALPGLKEQPGTHEALAEVYDHFGQTSLAARHRTMAEQLRARTGRRVGY